MIRKQRAQAIVELAVILPAFLLIALGMFDLGRAFYFQETITNAARDGARFGAITKNVTTGEIETRAVEEVGSLTGVSATACVSHPPIHTTCPVNAVMGNYVQVETEYSFDLITPFVQAVVGVSSIPLTATATQPRATGFSN